MTVKNENGITSITPSEGMRLYDGETIAEGTVYLGRYDAPENWREVSESEAAEIEAQNAARAEREVEP